MQIKVNKQIDPATSRLLKLAILDPLTGWLADDTDAGLEQAYQELLTEINHPECTGIVKAYIDNTLVGFAIIDTLRDALRYMIHNRIPNAHQSISLIYTDNLARQRGIGKAMVNHAKQLHSNYVWVSFIENKPSMDLARACGFTTSHFSTNGQNSVCAILQWLKP